MGPLCVYCIFGLKSNTLLYYNMKLRDKLKYFNLSLIKTAIYRSGILDKLLKAKITCNTIRQHHNNKYIALFKIRPKRCI